jgi:hypothetical protein
LRKWLKGCCISEKDMANCCSLMKKEMMPEEGIKENFEGRLFEEPLSNREPSIVLCQDLEVSPWMLADRASFRHFSPFKDVAAVAAVPFYRGILFEGFPSLHVF